MSHKASQKNWEKQFVLDTIKKNLLKAHSQKYETTQDITDRQSLEYQKQQAEINQLTQHTESLKQAEKLKKRFTIVILIYLCVYTLMVMIPIWWFLYLNPQATGVHYVLVALIGSLTVGFFQCIRAVALGVFSKDKK